MKAAPTFNEQALRTVEQIITNIEDNRLREAFEALVHLKHELVVQVRREKQLETEVLK